MLNESKTVSTDTIIASQAARALPADVIPAELAAFVPRVRAILGAINTLTTEVARLQDCVCPEYRPSAEEEAHRWLDLLEPIRADLARILAGAKSCDAELAAALDGLRDGDIRIWRAMSRHIVGMAYAREEIIGGEGSFHTDGNGAVLSAIGEVVKRPARGRKSKAKGSRKTGGAR